MGIPALTGMARVGYEPKMRRLNFLSSQAKGLWAWDVSALVYRWTYGPVAHALDDALLAEVGRTVGGGVVLDCGCGPGVVSLKLANAGARCVIAADVSPGMLAQIPPHPAIVPIQVALGSGRIQALREAHAPEGFALVLFKRSLYAPESEARVLLAEAWDALAPGGVIAIAHPEGSLLRYAFGTPTRLRSYTAYHLFNRTISRIGAWIGAEHYTTPRAEALLARARAVHPDARAVPFPHACFNLVVIERPP